MGVLDWAEVSRSHAPVVEGYKYLRKKPHKGYIPPRTERQSLSGSNKKLPEREDMDAIPNELLSIIVEHACSDGGSTASALLLVSRRIRDSVQPFLYTTIAVEGIKQLRELQSRLDSRPEHLRRVRHAFISTKAQGHLQEDNNYTDSIIDDCRYYDEELAEMSKLLNAIAPTVLTLTFLANNSATSTMLCARVLETPFPHLEELTLSGFYPYPCASNMPMLRSLHLLGNRNPHGLFQLGSLDAYPALTHLRISGLTGAVSFANELKNVLLAEAGILEDVDPFDMGLADSSSRLPSGLVSVQVQVDPTRVEQGYRAKCNERMLRTLRDLQETVRERNECRFSFDLLSGPTDEGDIGILSRKNWRNDRIGS